jgi:hypothetical protein
MITANAKSGHRIGLDIALRISGPESLWPESTVADAKRGARPLQEHFNRRGIEQQLGVKKSGNASAATLHFSRRWSVSISFWNCLGASASWRSVSRFGESAFKNDDRLNIRLCPDFCGYRRRRGLRPRGFSL